MPSSQSILAADLSPRQLRKTYLAAAYITLIVLGCAAVAFLTGPVYGLVVIAALLAPYAFLHPRMGMCLTLGIIMFASIIAPPAGFEYGIGYSPELIYWAIAVCILLLALSLRYVWWSKPSNTNAPTQPTLPFAFYAFGTICLISAAIGFFKGYAIENVAKQLFGCVLFCAFYLFSLKFAPSDRDVHAIVKWTVQLGLACSIAYICIYIAQIPTKGIRKELTILSAYGGGLAVLFLPSLVKSFKTRGSGLRVVLPALILFTVPIFGQYKRAILAFVICAILAVGLRSASRVKRYAYLITACTFFTLSVATNMLSPIGGYFAKYDSLRYLFPEDIQNTYSVFLRVEEVRQVVGSLGGTPIFGSGLGNTIIWYNPYTHELQESETMDVGWAYLFVKTGIVGTIAFLWLIFALGKKSMQNPLCGLHLAVFLLFIFQILQMIADPFFFYFMTAPWAGMTCGFLSTLNWRVQQKAVQQELQFVG